MNSLLVFRSMFEKIFCATFQHVIAARWNMRNKFEFHSKTPHKKYISKNKQCLWEWLALAAISLLRRRRRRRWWRWWWWWVHHWCWWRRKGAHDSHIKLGLLRIVFLRSSQLHSHPSQSQPVSHHERVCASLLCSMYISALVCENVCFSYHHSHK